jgi:hypothetical protein
MFSRDRTSGRPEAHAAPALPKHEGSPS